MTNWLAGSALFRQKGLPVPLRPESFSPAAMPRTVPGKAGPQFFFSVGDRAFSMFVVSMLKRWLARSR